LVGDSGELGSLDTSDRAFSPLIVDVLVDLAAVTPPSLSQRHVPLVHVGGQRPPTQTAFPVAEAFKDPLTAPVRLLSANVDRCRLRDNMTRVGSIHVYQVGLSQELQTHMWRVKDRPGHFKPQLQDLDRHLSNRTLQLMTYHPRLEKLHRPARSAPRRHITLIQFGANYATSLF